MSQLADLLRRVDELERQLASIVRVGRVSSASAAAGTARVTFDDDDAPDGGIVTHDLPVLQQRTKGSRDYHVLQPDEQVLCLFLPAGGEQGFVLGCHYSDADAPPLDDAAARVIAGGDIRIGSAGATDAVALEPAVKAAMQTLKDAIQNAVTVPQDGGAALKANILAPLAAWPPSTMGATKVKAE